MTPPRQMGLAISSLVLGIVALFLSLIVVGIFFGVAGLILGAMHIFNKRGPTAMAWWGLTLSSIAIIASIGLGLVYWRGFNLAKTYFQSVTKNFQQENTENDPSRWEGVVAPDISVTTLDGQTINLSQLKGKRVVLDFWATWCGPCVSEIPHFNKLYQETSRQDLVIVGISQEDQATLKSFVKRKAVAYPIASATGLPSPYGDVQTFPTTFFIDRNGVIQSVAVGARDFTQLKTAALTKDFEGEAATAPAPVRTGLEESETMLTAVELWSNNQAGAQGLYTGDWDQDGTMDLLVLDNGKKLHVLSQDGKAKSSVGLPAQFSVIECGRHQSKGVRLLGYSNWERKVTVMDSTGKEIWTYLARMGVNGAHWGDLDGDGNDEMMVGENGFGGLHAVSAEG
jgi:peroxiredoxin